MVAVHLLRDPRWHDSRIAIVERTGRFTAGVAYGTAYESHTLNVPAGRMSAFADDADDFLAFARSRDPTSPAARSCRAASTAPTSLDAARRRGGAEHRDACAGSPGRRRRSSLSRTGRLASASNGADPIVADRVVLAIGNFPPADPSITDPAFYSDPRYARDPWAADALDADPDRPVLLDRHRPDDARHRARVARPRPPCRDPRRFAPRAAASASPRSLGRPAALPATAGPRRLATHGSRAAPEAARRGRRPRRGHGIDWREVHTSLRADTPALWMSLSQTEKERFLRHARPYWETHRHRSSPQTAAAIRRELLAPGTPPRESRAACSASSRRRR